MTTPALTTEAGIKNAKEEAEAAEAFKKLADAKDQRELAKKNGPGE